jgi:hypothetical protein
MANDILKRIDQLLGEPVNTDGPIRFIVKNSPPLSKADVKRLKEYQSRWQVARDVVDSNVPSEARRRYDAHSEAVLTAIASGQHNDDLEAWDLDGWMAEAREKLRLAKEAAGRVTAEACPLVAQVLTAFAHSGSDIAQKMVETEQLQCAEVGIAFSPSPSLRAVASAVKVLRERAQRDAPPPWGTSPASMLSFAVEI